MIKDNPMMEKYSIVSWCPADVKDMRPDWSDEKCQEMLAKVSGHLEGRIIDSGWEILDFLLEFEEKEENA